MTNLFIFPGKLKYSLLSKMIPVFFFSPRPLSWSIFCAFTAVAPSSFTQNGTYLVVVELSIYTFPPLSSEESRLLIRHHFSLPLHSLLFQPTSHTSSTVPGAKYMLVEWSKKLLKCRVPFYSLHFGLLVPHF